MQRNAASPGTREGGKPRNPHRFDAASLALRLAEGLATLRIAATDEQAAKLIEFLALLQKWNATYNLTAVRDPEDMLTVHLLDSLSVLHLVDRLAAGPVLDVGSGAGLPAIPLAILRPSLLIDTVDAVAKKIGFQLQVRTALGLHGLRPHHARIEDFSPAAAPSLVVSRAYSDLPTMLASIDHVVTHDTTVLAMKGIEPTAELAQVVAPWRIREVVSLDVPFLGARRCAVVLERTD